MKRNISHKHQKFNQILSEWTSFYREDTSSLVKHLLSKGYTYQEIGKILGTSKQAVFQKYGGQDGKK